VSDAPQPSTLSDGSSSPAQRLWQLWRSGGQPDVHAFLAQTAAQSSLELLAVLRIDQRERWQIGLRVPVEDYLRQQPALQADEELILDLIQSEVLLREELGESPRLEEYQKRFPDHGPRLERLFTLHHALLATPSLPQFLPSSKTESTPQAVAETLKTGLGNRETPGTSETASHAAGTSSGAGMGARVSGYELLDELGRGGMGVVYRARQTSLRRMVALKMILAGPHASHEELARFRAEAESVARLQHPNIVQIYEVGEYHGHAYFSLEFIDGGTVASRLANAPLSARQAAELLETLARAIHYAHLRGIVHRDLKPSNVLLTLDGTPKIADFGLAKQVGDNSGQTLSGSILGTPGYMAPEQAWGRVREIGPATDVYALGAILYETLTGRPPFRGETALETLEQVRSQDPVPPRRLRSQLPLDLETICLNCLRKEPGRRYAGAGELAEDLRRFRAGEPIYARPTPAWERGWKWVRRRPTLAGLIAVSCLAVFVIALGGILHNIRLRAALNETEEQRDQATQAHADADRQRRQAEERLEQLRRSMYALQLERVAAAADRDPWHGLQMLRDAERCPAELRDFSWGFLYRHCQRDRLVLQGHTDGVRAVALSSDGRILASAGTDRLVKLWDLSAGKECGTLHGHTAAINAVAFTPDGRLLASADEDGAIRLWDPRTGAERRTWHGHHDPVNAVAFTADGQTLASASTDGTVKLWETASGREQRTLRGHTASVFGVAFAPNGQTLATASKDGTARLWDRVTGQEQRCLRGHRSWVTAVAFAPDGRTLATGGVDRAIKLWDREEGKERLALLEHRGAIGSLAFSPDGRTLVSGSYDHTLRVWWVASGRDQVVLKGHEGAIPSIAFAPNGRQVVSGSLDRTVRLWELRPSQESTVLRGHTRPVAAVAFAPDGRLLASGGYDRVVRLRDGTGEREQAALQEHAGWISCLAFAPHGREIACGDGSGCVKLWDLARRRERLVLRADPLWVTSLAFASEGRLLATAGNTDRAIKLWDADTGQEQGRLAVPEEILSLAFAPRTGLLAGASGSGKVWIWDLATRQEHATFQAHQGEIRSLAFSPDGRILASAGMDGTARLWKGETAQELAVLSGHAGAIHAVAFTPDGKMVATAGADRTVKLWDAVTGQERATLSGHRGEVNALAFTPDGQILASASGDETVRLWKATGE
jgi:WD40 repeat protein